MPTEQVTIVVHSSVGEDGPLTVQDGLRQVLDFFEWLSASVGNDEQESLAWNLTFISRNSPLHATADPISLVPGIDAQEAARRAKAVVATEIAALTNGGDVPPWMGIVERTKAAAMMRRNLGAISRTDIFLFEEGAPFLITEKNARSASFKLEQIELALAANEEDLSRREMGSVEGRSAEPTTFFGRPAIRVRERISGKSIICALSAELADKIGPSHQWSEAWSSQRILVSGEILYGKDGLVARVNASDLTFLPEPKRVSYKDLAMPHFTSGVTPVEYLNWLWREDVG